MADPNFEKPVPNEPKPAPAFDPDRQRHTNLAPQGSVNLGAEAPNTHYTPEGDGEGSPNIPVE